MATAVYRNVDMTAVLLRDLPMKIAEVHRETAAEYTERAGYKTNDYSVFAFRKYQRPRKYAMIEGIPDKQLYLPASIGITTAGGTNYAVEIATEFVAAFFRRAPFITGNYHNSLRITLNGKMRALSSLQKIQAMNPLRSGEIVEIWSTAEYASTLEAPNYNADGIFLEIAKVLLAKWGANAAIKFTYRSGKKFGLGFKYMTPVIMISARGEFASSLRTRRGYQIRKRQREARKAERMRKAGERQRSRGRS